MEIFTNVWDAINSGMYNLSKWIVDNRIDAPWVK